MPRETTNRMRYNRCSSKGSKEYDYQHDRRTVHRSFREKLERSRSPFRNRRRGCSKSRSRSISGSRRKWRGKSRSEKHSSSRSRSRSVSPHKGHKKNRKSSPKTARHNRLNSETFRDSNLNLSVNTSTVKPLIEGTSAIQVKIEDVTEEDDCASGKQNSNDCEYKIETTYFEPNLEEPIDKEKIHKQIEEKLRIALAKEGKVYPLPKSEASHPVFANDGSFLEVFKKMQEQAKQKQQMDSVKISKPMCKRRGGKILKTGIVTKPKAESSSIEADPKDFWSIYLQEVKKYKSASCDIESKTRPLVK